MFLSVVWIILFEYCSKAIDINDLLLISVSFFSDRKKSGKKINYTHHCIRLLIHLLMIGCLFLWF